MSRYPLEGYRETCNTKVTLGTRYASKPLELDIPITIAGDSKGGEDAAYLYMQSTNRYQSLFQQTFNLPANKSINHSIQTIYQAINQSINQPIIQSKQSTNHSIRTINQSFTILNSLYRLFDFRCCW